MSNFEAFNKEYINRLLDPFVPGMADHITPISYLAYTPDIFMFLFRTTGKYDQDYYFVTFQYDYLANIDQAEGIVKQWLGTMPKRKLPLSDTGGTDNEQFVCEDDNVYKCILFQVPRPQKLGYWSENIVVSKGDNLDDKLKDCSSEQRAQVATLLADGSDERQISVYARKDDIDMYYND